MPASTASRLRLNWYPGGAFKYGGSGWPERMAEERSASSEVISCEVTFASETTRRKEVCQWAEAWVEGERGGD
jgi:hypothetical protein